MFEDVKKHISEIGKLEFVDLIIMQQPPSNEW